MELLLYIQHCLTNVNLLLNKQKPFYKKKKLQFLCLVLYKITRKKFKAIPLFQSCECNLQSDNLCLLDTEKQAIADMYLGPNAPKILPSELHCCVLCKENQKLNISEFLQHLLSIYKQILINYIKKVYMVHIVVYHYVLYLITI